MRAVCSSRARDGSSTAKRATCERCCGCDCPRLLVVFRAGYSPNRGGHGWEGIAAGHIVSILLAGCTWHMLRSFVAIVRACVVQTATLLFHSSEHNLWLSAVCGGAERQW